MHFRLGIRVFVDYLFLDKGQGRKFETEWIKNFCVCINSLGNIFFVKTSV